MGCEAGLGTLGLALVGLIMCQGAFSVDAEQQSSSPSNVSVNDDLDGCYEYFLQYRRYRNITVLDVPSRCRISRYNLPSKVMIALVLGCLIISTAVGNALVILAVILVKKLQTPNNLLIVSLASSDFLVAVLVLPWALLAQLEGMWIFDSALCDMFMIFDMTLCTSSILNLCAISIDRYLVVTRPFTYGVKRTNVRMLSMIAVTWLLSVMVAVPPYIGWKEPFIPGVCNYSEDLGYQIYATFGAFYLPLFVMLVLYGRIFRLAHRIARADARMKMCSAAVHHDHEDLEGPGARGSSCTGDSQVEMEHVNLTVRLVRFKSESSEACFSHGILRHSTNGTKGANESRHHLGFEDAHRGSLTPASQTPSGFSSGTASPACNDSMSPPKRSTSPHHNILRRTTKKKSAHKNTETKAIKTLGVIMGCFTLCWLPFFIVQVSGVGTSKTGHLKRPQDRRDRRSVLWSLSESVMSSCGLGVALIAHLMVLNYDLRSHTAALGQIS